MYGHEIAPPPTHLDGCRVLLRTIDGLAFRFHWATEGLRPEDYAFRPADDCMSMHELVEHMLHLVFMIEQTIAGSDTRGHFENPDPEVLRAEALERLHGVRARLEELEDAQLATHEVLKRDRSRFPVWNIMNGPIADALTHVGQINAWRRLNGNPTKRINVFTGSPTSETKNRD